MNLKETARLMRSNGASISEIAEQVGIVKSTASIWTRDIVLTDVQKEILVSRGRMKAGSESARLHGEKISDSAKHRRISHQSTGRLDAQKGSTDHLRLCMLYWAEGAKQKNVVRLGNTDIDLLRVFVHSLKQFFNVEDKDLYLTVRAYSSGGLNENQIRQYWKTGLGLSESVVQVIFDWDKRPKSGWRKNVHPYGVCEVNLNSTEIVQRIFGAIQEYGGFERPEWLGRKRVSP